MPRRFVRFSIVCILASVSVAAFAAEGRTPVFAPGALLGADGKYIVTRNLAVERELLGRSLGLRHL